jgi:hypothetical protein
MVTPSTLNLGIKLGCCRVGPCCAAQVMRVNKGCKRHRKIFTPWARVGMGFTAPKVPAHVVIGVLIAGDCDGWFIEVGIGIGVGAHEFRVVGCGGRICGLDVVVEMRR